MKKNLFLIVTATLMLCSCGSVRDFNYFQDTNAGDVTQINSTMEAVKIQPYDKISILVSCKDPQLSAMYNLATSSIRAGSTSVASSASGSYISYYTVDPEGNIDFPVLGKIHVAGLTRPQIVEKVKQELTTAEQGVKDAVVTVEYVNLHIGVLGEVKSQGIFSIERDQFTILDAIARAGDLTQYGNRKNIKVFRKHGNQQTTYQVDLTNYNELCSSPVYMLQQDDIIYVEPSKVRARQSTTIGNTLLTPTFWISALTFAMTVANFMK